MFRPVKCHAYLRKVKDGKYFFQDNEDRDVRPYLRTYTMICGCDENGKEISKECEFYDGTETLLKTYYERTENEFCGVVVATTMVAVKKMLYADTEFPEYGPDYRYIGKETKESVKCARVFYANGKSRLVPLDDLEIMEEEK